MKLFIGSSAQQNIDSRYYDDCKKLLQGIVDIEKVELVFGAHPQGLMGLCYDEFQKKNRNIIGIMTDFHKKMGNQEHKYTQEIIVSSTTLRFEKIYETCDLLLFLPGGLGTYAEIFSAIEEGTIEKGKKIIIYNNDYFYTPMIKELYRLYQEGFIDRVPADYMIIENDIDSILKLIKEEMD